MISYKYIITYCNNNDNYIYIYIERERVMNINIYIYIYASPQSDSARRSARCRPGCVCVCVVAVWLLLWLFGCCLCLCLCLRCCVCADPAWGASLNIKLSLPMSCSSEFEVSALKKSTKCFCRPCKFKWHRCYSKPNAKAPKCCFCSDGIDPAQENMP